MENIGSSESKDKTTTTESAADSPAKTNLALADLLLNRNTAEQHIWAREESAKEEKVEEDKKSSAKTKALPHLLPELKPDLPKPAPESPFAPKIEATVEAAADNTMEAADAQLAELEPDEARAITEQEVTRRRAELPDEEASWPVGSPERAAAVADAALMRKIAEKLRDRPEADPEQIVAESADEVIAEAGLGEVPPPDAEDDDPVTNNQAQTQTPPIPPPAAGGGGNQPPLPPNYPPTPGFPGHPGNPNGPNNPGGLNPNTGQPNSLATPNVAPNTWGSPNITPAEAQYYARQAENRGLVLGGIVGYLIGRRRGRIKTEKRLLPIQRRLEKQVTNLHDTIASREQQVRTLAAEKVRATQVAKTAETALTPILRPTEANRLPDRPPLPPQTDTAPRPELIPIPLPAAATEKLQVTAETLPGIGSPEKHVERMNQEELLSTAETVIIEGASLRQIYEAHQVTEKGLRHIMTEHLRGGDVKKALDQELKIKELTYERDPRMRAQMSGGSPPQAASGASTGVNGQAPVLTDNPTSNPSGTPVTNSASDTHKDQSAVPAKKPPAPNNILQGTLIRAWVVLIVALVIMAVILLFR